jgi:mRNA interferase MazF
VNVGQLFWVGLPARGGQAQTGRRPTIIAQVPSTLSTVLLIPLTSQLDALRFPGTVLIEANKENGLSRNSVALVFQLAAIDKRFVKSQLGETSDEWKAR